MTAALYTREILRLAVSIPHQGRLDDPHSSAEVRSRTCGSRVVADLNLSATGRIENLGLEVNACALGQASAAIVGGEAVGRSLIEFQQARQALADFLIGQTTTPGSWNNIEKLAVAKDHNGRHAAILLPFDAIIASFQKLSRDVEKQEEAVK